MIRETLKKLGKQHQFDHIVYGQITNVRPSEQLCDVIPSNGDAEIFDARLQTTDDKAVLFVPKDKTFGLVVMESETSGFLIWAEQNDSCQLKVGDTYIYVSKSGIEIKKGQTDLKAILLDFLKDYDNTLDLLTKPLFVAGQIPVTLLPTVLPTIVKKKVELAKVKTNINTIFK
jgi:hypothetical protein